MSLLIYTVTYLDLSINDDSAKIYWPHGEVEGKPGYTGRWSGDRAMASDYPWNAGWEVISFDNDPIVSVDNLIATVFHRLTLIACCTTCLGRSKDTP